MPGRRRPCQFGNVACTRTLRVDSSTIGSMAVTRPWSVSASAAVADAVTTEPGGKAPTLCCGREKFTYRALDDCSGPTGCPLWAYWPRLTLRMPVAAAH